MQFHFVNKHLMLIKIYLIENTVISFLFICTERLGIL